MPGVQYSRVWREMTCNRKLAETLIVNHGACEQNFHLSSRDKIKSGEV